MDGIASVGSAAGATGAYGVPMATSSMTASSSLAILSTEEEDDDKKTILIAASQQQTTYAATGQFASSTSGASACGASLDVTA